MKRAVLPALMMILLLCSCGDGAAIEEAVEARRDALAAAEEVTFTADVTADAGDEVFACTLACTATPEAVTMEALSPELVAGVKASLSAGETTLEYGGVQLSVGGADGFGPFAALPLLCDGLRTGHVVRAWTEESMIAAGLYVGDDLDLTVWFDADTMVPLHAEVSRDGRAVIKCAIRDFAVQ